MRIHLVTPALFNKAWSHLIVHTCTWVRFPWFYRDKHYAPPVCLRNYKQPIEFTVCANRLCIPQRQDVSQSFSGCPVTNKSFSWDWNTAFHYAWLDTLIKCSAIWLNTKERRKKKAVWVFFFSCGTKINLSKLHWPAVQLCCTNLSHMH